MLHVLKSEVFILVGGGGGGVGQGWGTWPPLSEFSGSAPARVLYTSIHLFMECFSTTSGESCRYCVVPENIHTPTTDGSLVFAPHPLGISLPEGHLWTPPPPRNFHFFWRGFFLKLMAFLSLNKSEKSTFIFTQPSLVICCTH